MNPQPVTSTKALHVDFSTKHAQRRLEDMGQQFARTGDRCPAQNHVPELRPGDTPRVFEWYKVSFLESFARYSAILCPHERKATRYLRKSDVSLFNICNISAVRRKVDEI